MCYLLLKIKTLKKRQKKVGPAPEGSYFQRFVLMSRVGPIASVHQMLSRVINEVVQAVVVVAATVACRLESLP